MHSTLRITQNCNLNCLHCYSHSPQKTKDLPTQKIKSIIDILTKNNITHITISGGEPFTRHDATELISYSAKKTKTGIVTNATLIDKATAKKLSEINLTRLMISLDGTESHHNRLRAENSYAKAREGIRNCQNNRVPIGISTTLTTINHNHLAGIHNYLKENNIPRWIIQTLKPQGMARHTNLHLTPKQQNTALKTINHLQSTEPDIKISIFNCEQNCSAGTKTISVSPNGDVTPCAFMPGAICANILKDPWDKITAKIKEYQKRGITCFQN